MYASFYVPLIYSMPFPWLYTVPPATQKQHRSDPHFFGNREEVSLVNFAFTAIPALRISDNRDLLSQTLQTCKDP